MKIFFVDYKFRLIFVLGVPKLFWVAVKGEKGEGRSNSIMERILAKQANFLFTIKSAERWHLVREPLELGNNSMPISALDDNSHFNQEQIENNPPAGFDDKSEIVLIQPDES